jgi:hypothetical protein
LNTGGLSDRLKLETTKPAGNNFLQQQASTVAHRIGNKRDGLDSRM